MNSRLRRFLSVGAMLLFFALGCASVSGDFDPEYTWFDFAVVIAALMIAPMLWYSGGIFLMIMARSLPLKWGVKVNDLKERLFRFDAVPVYILLPFGMGYLLRQLFESKGNFRGGFGIIVMGLAYAFSQRLCLTILKFTERRLK
jgi:hypothetical protein